MQLPNANNPASNRSWFGWITGVGTDLSSSNDNQAPEQGFSTSTRVWLGATVGAMFLTGYLFGMAYEREDTRNNLATAVAPAVAPIAAINQNNNHQANNNNHGHGTVNRGINSNVNGNGNNRDNGRNNGNGNSGNNSNNGNNRRNSNNDNDESDSKDNDNDDDYDYVLGHIFQSSKVSYPGRGIREMDHRIPILLPAAMEEDSALFIIVMEHYRCILSKAAFKSCYPVVINPSFRYPYELSRWGPNYYQAGLDIEFALSIKHVRKKRVALFDLTKVRDPDTDKMRYGVLCNLNEWKHLGWKVRMKEFAEHMAWLLATFYLIYDRTRHEKMHKFLKSIWKDLSITLMLDNLETTMSFRQGSLGIINDMMQWEHIQSIKRDYPDYYHLNIVSVFKKLLMNSCFLVDRFYIVRLQTFTWQYIDRVGFEEMLEYLMTPHVQLQTHLLTVEMLEPWMRLDWELDDLIMMTNEHIASLDIPNDGSNHVVDSSHANNSSLLDID